MKRIEAKKTTHATSESYHCVCGKTTFCIKNDCSECKGSKSIMICGSCRGPERLAVCSEPDCIQKGREYFDQKEECNFCYKTERCLHSALLRTLDRKGKGENYCVYPGCGKWICSDCTASSMCVIVEENRCLDHHSGVSMWFSAIENSKRVRHADTDIDTM